MKPGDRIGHYQIGERLGAGGMGEVYKAYDTRLDRPVAIKTLREEFVSDPDRRRRFVQEARAASALDHPNIVTIHDIAEENGSYFIVAQYVSGETLGERIRDGRLDLHQTIDIAVQMADGLGRAHEAGIVHRDLKPDNVMVGEDGRVRIVDFGLAKLTEKIAVESDAETVEKVRPLTREGEIVGTGAYMSPEQAQGKKVDAKSDIFSFGSVLYEMVTGKPAFTGETIVSVLAAILRDEPERCRNLAPAVPVRLESVIERALRKEPGERFQTMGELRAALIEVKDEPKRVGETPHSQILQIGDFDLDLEAGELRRYGHKIKLQGRPFQILTILIERPGRVVSREEIFKRVWPPDTFVDFDNSVNAAVRKLRSALRDSAEDPQYIETVAGRGYRYIGPDPVRARSVLPDPTPEPEKIPAPKKTKRRPYAALVGTGVVVLMVFGALFLNWQNSATRPEELPSNVIAVFPFEVRGSGDVEHLNEGVAVLLSTTLGGVEDQRTVDPNSLLGYLSREQIGTLDPESAAPVAHRFEAGRFVLGTVVESGGKIRPRATLYDTSDGTVVASASAEGDELFAVVDQLTAQLLVTERGGAIERDIRAAATTTESLPAFKAYLEGERALRRGINGRRDAQQAFQRAVELDPTFSLAWAKLAHTVGWSNQTNPTFDYLGKALEHSDRLTEIDRMRVEALDHNLQGRAEEAERLYQGILREHAEDEWSWYFMGDVLRVYNWQRGRSKSEARPFLERAIEIDPGLTDAAWSLMAISGYERKPDEAKKWATQIFGEDFPAVFRVLRAYYEGTEEDREEIVSNLHLANDFMYGWTVNQVAFSAAVSPRGALDVATARVIIDRATNPDRQSDVARANAHIVKAHLALAAGQWSEAKRDLETARSLRPDNALAHTALLAAAPTIRVPAADLAAVRSLLSDWTLGQAAPLTFDDTVGSDGVIDDAPPMGTLSVNLLRLVRLYGLGNVSVRLGESEPALRYADELETLPGPEHVDTLPKDLARAVRARVALNEGRVAEALSLLEENEMRALRKHLYYHMGSPFYTQAQERFLRAELLLESGRDEEAERWYNTLPWADLDFTYSAIKYLRLADIQARRGEAPEAIANYERFIAMWQDCDPEEKHLLDEAQKQLDRLRSS